MSVYLRIICVMLVADVVHVVVVVVVVAVVLFVVVAAGATTAAAAVVVVVVIVLALDEIAGSRAIFGRRATGALGRFARAGAARPARCFDSASGSRRSRPASADLHVAIVVVVACTCTHRLAKTVCQRRPHGCLRTGRRRQCKRHVSLIVVVVGGGGVGHGRRMSTVGSEQMRRTERIDVHDRIALGVDADVGRCQALFLFRSTPVRLDLHVDIPLVGFYQQTLKCE